MRAPLAALGCCLAALLLPAIPAEAAGLTIDITCRTPQPYRMTSPEDCLNHVSDPTQTYTAVVRSAGGRPRAGVHVRFLDNGPDAFFRPRHRDCWTDRTGRCSDELKELTPTAGEVIRATAVIVGTGRRDSGTLTFVDHF